MSAKDIDIKNRTYYILDDKKINIKYQYDINIKYFDPSNIKIDEKSWLWWKIFKNRFWTNKTVEIPIMTIAVRAAFLESNKHYSQVFLDECLYKM